MRYFPTIDVTDQTRMLLSSGALRLQPGQWVVENGRRGRYLRTNLRTAVSYFSWERSDENWRAQVQRFHRACVKGFVGKYAPAYEYVSALRQARREAPAAAERDLPF